MAFLPLLSICLFCSENWYKLNDVLKGHQDYMDELYDKIDELKTGTIGGDNIDEWEAPTHSDIL